MTWTYSQDPKTSPRNAMRFMLNDVTSTDPLFSDEELDYLLYEWVDVYEACRAGAETLAAKFERLAETTSKSVGDIKVTESYRLKSKSYRELAGSFIARRMRKSPPSPWASPNSLKATGDRVNPVFSGDFHIGQNDNVGSSNPSSVPFSN